MTNSTNPAVSSVFAPPDEKGYSEATASFDLDAHLTPDLAAVATTHGEVVAAILEARNRGMGVRTHSTGHAAKASRAMSGEALIRTRIEAPVIIDPVDRTARIPAGTLWGAVVEAAAPHGLVAIHGSSPTVGAIGFLLGGGLSSYGRMFGVSANSVLSITLTLSSGETVTTSDTAMPELFWALRGGGGGFGIVIEIEIQLYEMKEIITGAAFWPAAEAAKIAPLWRKWTETAPLAVTTSLRVMNLPPIPGIPAVLTSGAVLVLDGAITIEDGSSDEIPQRILDDLLTPLLRAATPLMNTWARAAASTLPLTHMDPHDPIPALGDHMLLTDLSDETLLEVIDCAAADATLVVFELRQLGGCFAEPLSTGGAFDRTPARFLYLGIGAVFDDAARARIEIRLVRVREVLGNWDSGFTAPTFVGNYNDPQRTFDDETEAQVVGIRAELDPIGMFAGDVSPVRDRVEAH